MEEDESNNQSSSVNSSTHQRGPTISISIPPRGAADALFTGAKSPGPMTILSNFFSDYLADENSSGETRTFSQLLNGVIASPSLMTENGEWSSLLDEEECGNGERVLGSVSATAVTGFREKRPGNLVVPVSPLLGAVSAAAVEASPVFTPSIFINSPGMILSPSSLLCPFDMSHQQALAQVTAQAAMNQAAGYQAPSSLPAPTEAFIPILQFSAFDAHLSSVKDETLDPVGPSHSDTTKAPNPPLAVDKPINDGYNWRKYGQKHVKGSQYPRSYYRCTHRGCLVKKKVERSFEGHITEIIYKGQHNHELPQKGKKGKERADGNDVATAQLQCDAQWSSLGGDVESVQATSIQLNGPSDSEESGEGDQRVHEDDDAEPEPKRRNIESGTSEAAVSHKTVTEPKIILQTRSEVDLLDDGYKWRKYGQKVVKGNPNPRSYYKCTTTSCNVRKHIERSHTDPKSVITTYEGKHTHDLPAARGSRTIEAAQPAKLQAING